MWLLYLYHIYNVYYLSLILNASGSLMNLFDCEKFLHHKRFDLYFNESDFFHIQIFIFNQIKIKFILFTKSFLFFLIFEKKTKPIFSIQFIFSHHFKITFYHRLSSNQIESVAFWQMKIFIQKLFSTFSTLKSFRFIQKTFSFTNKSFSHFLSNYRINKNIFQFFFFFYFIQIKSSSLQKSFLSNIHSTTLRRIYIEFLYSMIVPINDIKILLSIEW
jgi:hypothetical protein